MALIRIVCVAKGIEFRARKGKWVVVDCSDGSGSPVVMFGIASKSFGFGTVFI